MKIHTRKRAMLMRSFARRNDSFGADTEGFALSSQRKAQITRRNTVSAQEPKKFALSSQRKLSVLLMVGIIILSAKECEMGPGGDGSKMPGGGDPGPVVNDPLAPTGPLSLASSMEVDTELSFSTTDGFGWSLAFAGDLDGGGGTVLAVGAIDSDGSTGAIYLLSYDDKGTLQSTKKIANGVDETNSDHALAPTLADSGKFGSSIANAGDLNGDGGTVLAVGALGTESNKGAIYLLSFSTAGNLTSAKKIGNGLDETNGTAETSNTLAPSLANNDFFGISLANAGDLDGGGGTVLAVGAAGDDTGGNARGAIYFLSFNPRGNLIANTTVNSDTPNGPGLQDFDSLGDGGIANVGDLDGGGGTVLAVGLRNDDTGGSDRGTIYLLSFDDSASLTSTKKIAHGLDETNADSNANAPSLVNSAFFGISLANAGDLDGGGGTVLAVGAWGADSRSGTIYLLSFNTSANLTATTFVASGTAKAAPMLSEGDLFGASIANVGNLDGSGGRVLAVGTGTTNAVWLLKYSKD